MDKYIIKYFAGELTSDERYKFLKEVDNDQTLKKEFINFQNIYSVSQLLPHDEDKTEGKRSFDSFISMLNKSKRILNLRNIMKYTAVIVAVISSTVLSTLYLSDRMTENSYNTLYVPVGQRAQITLEDGTNVWLNAQSTLKYPSKFSKKDRIVEIEGEAYFDVAKNSKRPFIVNANQVTLEVLGTQFNIYSYEETGYTETILVEGLLKVSDNLNKNNSVIIKPNQEVFYKCGELTVSTISNTDHLLWRDGIYSFDNEKLIDIIEKLELYYDVEIIVEDPEIFNFNYTGKFRQRDGIDEILRILQIIQPFKIEKDKENNKITLNAY